MADTTGKYLEFLSFCSKLLKGESIQFIDLIKKRYNECSKSFRTSTEMADLLDMTRVKLLTDRKRMFVHLKDLTTELRAWSAEKKTPQQRQKRKAEGSLTAVSKIRRTEDSMSEGSDAEGKLCRALGSGSADGPAVAASCCSQSSNSADRSCAVQAVDSGDSDVACLDDVYIVNGSALESPLDSLSTKRTHSATVSGRAAGTGETDATRLNKLNGTNEAAGKSGAVSGESAALLDKSKSSLFSKSNGSRLSNQVHAAEGVSASRSLQINPGLHSGERGLCHTETLKLKHPSSSLMHSEKPSSSTLGSQLTQAAGKTVPSGKPHSEDVSSSLKSQPTKLSHKTGSSSGLRSEEPSSCTLKSQPAKLSHKTGSSSGLRSEEPSSCSLKSQPTKLSHKTGSSSGLRSEELSGCTSGLQHTQAARTPTRELCSGKPSTSISGVQPKIAETILSGGLGSAEQPSCSLESQDTETDPKTERHVRKLEKLLKKLHEEIDKVREKDLSLDDLDEENSSYIYEDRLQKKFVKVWNRLCQLKGRDTSSGRPVERRFKYEGTRYPEINRKIQKFVNRPDSFPDFHDIRNIVRKVNNRCKLGLSVMHMNSIARETFLDVGDALQKRRHEDFISTFRSKQTTTFRMDQDPAQFDVELKRKLENNGRIGKTRMEEVLSKYSNLQIDFGQDDSDTQKSDGEEVKVKRLKLRSPREEEEGEEEEADFGQEDSDSQKSDGEGVKVKRLNLLAPRTEEEEEEEEEEEKEEEEEEEEEEKEEDEEDEEDYNSCLIEMDVAEECHLLVEDDPSDTESSPTTTFTTASTVAMESVEEEEGMDHHDDQSQDDDSFAAWDSSVPAETETIILDTPTARETTRDSHTVELDRNLTGERDREVMEEHPADRGSCGIENPAESHQALLNGTGECPDTVTTFLNGTVVDTDSNRTDNAARKPESESRTASVKSDRGGENPPKHAEGLGHGVDAREKSKDQQSVPDAGAGRGTRVGTDVSGCGAAEEKSQVPDVGEEKVGTLSASGDRGANVGDDSTEVGDEGSVRVTSVGAVRVTRVGADSIGAGCVSEADRGSVGAVRVTRVGADSLGVGSVSEADRGQVGAVRVTRVGADNIGADSLPGCSVAADRGQVADAGTDRGTSVGDDGLGVGCVSGSGVEGVRGQVGAVRVTSVGDGSTGVGSVSESGVEADRGQVGAVRVTRVGDGSTGAGCVSRDSVEGDRGQVGAVRVTSVGTDSTGAGCVSGSGVEADRGQLVDVGAVRVTSVGDDNIGAGCLPGSGVAADRGQVTDAGADRGTSVGTDSIVADAGTDSIVADAGTDSIVADAGTDSIVADAGTDRGTSVGTDSVGAETTPASGAGNGETPTVGAQNSPDLGASNDLTASVGAETISTLRAGLGEKSSVRTENSPGLEVGKDKTLSVGAENSPDLGAETTPDLGGDRGSLGADTDNDETGMVEADKNGTPTVESDGAPGLGADRDRTSVVATATTPDLGADKDRTPSAEAGGASRTVSLSAPHKSRTPVKISTSLNLPKFLVRRNGGKPSSHRPSPLFYPDKMQSLPSGDENGDSITIASSDEEGERKGEREGEGAVRVKRETLGKDREEVIELSDSD